MTIIYCSRKLENMIGRVGELPAEVSGSPMGDWNGHLFFVDRKKCLIFANNKTAYSIVMLDVRKQNMLYLESSFQKRVLEQLQYDLQPTEPQLAYASKSLDDIKITKTNNDQKILGTMHQFIDLIKYEAYQQGSLHKVNPLAIGGRINHYLIGTKIGANHQNKSYFEPIAYMKELLSTVTG